MCAGTSLLSSQPVTEENSEIHKRKTWIRFLKKFSEIIPNSWLLACCLISKRKWGNMVNQRAFCSVRSSLSLMENQWGLESSLLRFLSPFKRFLRFVLCVSVCLSVCMCTIGIFSLACCSKRRLKCLMDATVHTIPLNTVGLGRYSGSRPTSPGSCILLEHYSPDLLIAILATSRETNQAPSCYLDWCHQSIASSSPPRGARDTSTVAVGSWDREWPLADMPHHCGHWVFQ